MKQREQTSAAPLQPQKPCKEYKHFDAERWLAYAECPNKPINKPQKPDTINEPLSRRDQFAMAAMQAMTHSWEDVAHAPEHCRRSVIMADALIAELDKPSSPQSK